jgi:hypothetical protein
MIDPLRDVARIRFDNALQLFDEFVQATVKHPDAATLRGLERRFAERLQIQPSYWSQIKARSRQIGERLARQFEQLCHKPSGWMDQPHRQGSWLDQPGRQEGWPDPAQDAGTVAGTGARAGRATATPVTAVAEPAHNLPQDDDERFIVGLVLTYYRRHPARARARLLDLLGEVLGLTPPSAPAAVAKPSAAPPAEEAQDLWTRTRAGVAPLKRKPRR